jgi:hypothetical protein
VRAANGAPIYHVVIDLGELYMDAQERKLNSSFANALSLLDDNDQESSEQSHARKLCHTTSMRN